MKYLGLIILLLCMMMGCEEPIILDLPSGEPSTIIDANISESNVVSRVVLSKSLGFNDTINFPPIENASVVLAHGRSETSFSFNYVNTLSVGAVYEAQSEVTLISDDLYFFSVYLPGSIEDPDTLYQATMKMPTKVPVEGIRFRAVADESDQYVLRIFFTDPEGERNFYSWRVSQKINGEYVVLPNNKIPLYTDQGIDGKSVFVEFAGSNFSESDTVQVHFKSLTRDAYDYYRALNNLIDVSGTNTSADNPRSNFVSTAGDRSFGYFSLEGVHDTEAFAVADSL
ncbi:DUF4249 family protein [Flammeovirga aprica]|uniref:DUF4249 domain-containing protein n=1 Tax=Flammeovirga aprica JL-4 TaxID=694437 RepID=A0A7X9RR20_9BACT|nr:DUF4249 family protein [Flammeovirga aprica]NME67368.1 DUF4249 domain-containing protein [Flammeovirga aprica JL-4]